MTVVPSQEKIKKQLELFNEVLKQLDVHLSISNFDDLKLETFVQSLEQFYWSYNLFSEEPEAVYNKYRDDLGSLLAASPVFEKFFKLIYHLTHNYKDGKYPSDENPNQRKYKQHILDVISGAFHNFTDGSVQVCLSLTTCETFLKIYHEYLPAWYNEHMKGTLLMTNSRLVKKCMDYVYNCYFKNDTAIDSNLSQHDFVTEAKPYLNSPEPKTKFSALLLIIFAVDEKNADLYLAAKDNITHLISLLERAHKAGDRRCDGYHVVELAKCVDRLAKNDVNKELLVELKLLPVLKSMLTSKDLEEQNCVLDILFTLSFNEKNIGSIQTEFSDQLRELQKLNQFKGSKSLSGLAFLLFQDDVLEPESSGRTSRLTSAYSRRVSGTPTDNNNKASLLNKPTGHLMISYQHENKEVVTRIKNELAKMLETKVWIDYEQMVRGSTIEAMAEAVEKADIVLLCMSRKYKESNNCRLEGEYAWRNQKHIIPLLMELKYKPDGWLGIILGAQLYYDFSGKYPFESKMSDLVKAIQLQKNLEEVNETVRPLSASRTAATPTPIREHHFPSPYSSLPPIAAVQRSIIDWSDKDVAKWCQDKKLPTSVQNLKLTGPQIYFLLNAKNRAPESFYRLVEKKCPDFDIMADLVNALEDL